MAEDLKDLRLTIPGHVKKILLRTVRLAQKFKSYNAMNYDYMESKACRYSFQASFQLLKLENLLQ